MTNTTIESKNKKKGKFVVNGLKQGYVWFALILLFPSIFNFVLFWCYPNFNSIIFAFQNTDGSFTFNHFKWVFLQFSASDGGIMASALTNTLIYFSVGYFITQTWNIVLAYFFYKKILGAKFFRTMLYLPNMFAGIILVSMYKNIIGPEGPIISFLFNNGLIAEKPMLLFQESTAMMASIGYSLWVSVGSVLLWSSGAMARIPLELTEAGQLDGITPLKEFVHIILPMISGTLSTLYVIGISGVLGAGGATLFLTEGEYGTNTLSFWIWYSVYNGAGTGTSSALGLLMSAISIPLVFGVKWLAGKIVPEVSY